MGGFILLFFFILNYFSELLIFVFFFLVIISIIYKQNFRGYFLNSYLPFLFLINSKYIFNYIVFCYLNFLNYFLFFFNSFFKSFFSVISNFRNYKWSPVFKKHSYVGLLTLNKNNYITNNNKLNTNDYSIKS